MKREPSENEAIDKGYTKTPNAALNWFILARTVTKRERNVVDLVIRLTEGCHTDWAELRQAELMTVGIAANHAKEVLQSMLDKKILIRNPRNHNQYKLGELTGGIDEKAKARLRALISRHISHSGNSQLPKKAMSDLPKKEDDAYQKGNTEKLPKGELSRGDSPGIKQSKDTETGSRKNNDKNSTIAINPRAFRPHNKKEVAALKCWRMLEPDKPNCFGLYLFLANKLPIDVFYRIARDVHEDMEADNPGALFNRLAHDSLKEMKNGKADHENWF